MNGAWIKSLSIVTNSCPYLLKNTLKSYKNYFTPTCFGSHRDPSSGGHLQILGKVFTGSWNESI